MYIVIDQQPIELQKVKAEVVKIQGTQNTSQETSRSAFKISIEDIVPFVNGKDVLRYIPDPMIDEGQRKLKQEGIAETRRKTDRKNDEKYETKRPASYPHSWVDNNGNNKWEYWITYVVDKENTVWKATLNVATTTNGDKILYDINPIEMVEQSGTSDTISTNNRVS